MILVDHGRTTNRVLRRLHHPSLLCCISLSPTLVRLSLKRDQSCVISIPITHGSSTILFPGLWLKPTGLFQSPEVVSSLIISCLTMHLTLLHYHGHSNFCSDAVSTWDGGTAATSTLQSHFLSGKKWLGWIWVAMIWRPALRWLLGFPLTNRALSIRFSVHEPRKKQTNLIWCWIRGS